MKFSDLNKKQQETTVRPLRKFNTEEIKKEKKQETEQIKNRSEEEKSNIIPEVNTEERKPALEISDETVKNENEQEKNSEEKKEKEVFFSIRREEEKDEVRKPKYDEKLLKEKGKYCYSTLIENIEDIFKSVSYGTVVDKISEFHYITDLIYTELNDNPYFLHFLKYLTPKNYLYSHTVNTAILSGAISINLGMEEYEIKKTVMSALFIDIGMLNYMDIVLKGKKLSSREYEMIKSHVDDGIEIVDKILDMDEELKEVVKNVIAKHHERMDGSGYRGIGGDKLDLVSQIIAISDVYEAMTHKREYRDALEPSYVIQEIISLQKTKFNYKAVKGLVAALTLYPPGSLVKLSTGEIGMVNFINRKKPFRPIVKVYLDPQFETLTPYDINLIEYPLTAIEDYVKYAELKKKNPKFYASFEMSNLWIEW